MAVDHVKWYPYKLANKNRHESIISQLGNGYRYYFDSFQSRTLFVRLHSRIYKIHADRQIDRQTRTHTRAQQAIGAQTFHMHGYTYESEGEEGEHH